MNVDASVHIGKEEAGIGVIIRDFWGLVIGFARRVTGFFSPHIAECLALWEGLSFAQDLGLQIEITETYAVRLTSEVQNPSSIGENSVLIADNVELSKCGVSLFQEEQMEWLTPLLSQHLVFFWIVVLWTM